MARIQILELPEGASDDRPPFALIIDQASESTIDALGLNTQHLSILEAAQQNLQFSLAEQLGARVVLVFEETIEIPTKDDGLRETPASTGRRPDPADDTCAAWAGERDERARTCTLRAGHEGAHLDPSGSLWVPEVFH